jgi:hypothetical protein
MKKEIYECDKCHKQATTKEEIAQLALITFSIGTSIQYYSTMPSVIYPTFQTWQKELCKECRDGMGLTVKVLKDSQSTPPITFEDMVREIVQQEIQNQ